MTFTHSVILINVSDNLYKNNFASDKQIIMGNVLLDDYKKGDPAQGYNRWLEQNPDLVGKEILKQNKLFRISSFKINKKNILLKVFFKKDTSSLIEYLKIFDIFNSNIERAKANHLLPLRLVNTKDQKTFIAAARQKIHETLEEVISSKPTLNESQKKWMIYQMIRSVRNLHSKFNLYHGHIRTSNFVVTYYGYLMLTDFAFYQPLYILQDTEEGLPQFRLFYGSSYENCTLAPQKIAYQADFANRERNPVKIFAEYQQFSEDLGKTILQLGAKEESKKQKVNKQDIYKNSIDDLKRMDIFSLGCSICEVFRDGKSLLNYENLLQFKKGELNLEETIENLSKGLEHEEEIKELLIKMLKKDPKQRMQIDDVWKQWQKIVNHDVFNLFWHCLSAFSTTSFYLPDLRISLLHDIFKFIEKQLRNNPIHGLKVDPPKCFESFEALKIFKSIIKNKIIYVGQIPEGSLLDHIMSFTQKEEIVDSEEEIINEERDARREFFVPLKKKGSSLRLSTTATLKLEKVICPPQWDKQLVRLINKKSKGSNLSKEEQKFNHFQDILQEFKKTQYLRQYRLNQQSNYYEKFVMAIQIIFSSIRGCKYNASKLVGIELMMMIARQSNDQTRLRSIFPLLINLLEDPHRVVSHFAFNSLIDLFYMFIDPFQNEEDTAYYDALIQILINNIKTVKLRIVLFQRLTEIYNICEWLQVHIKKLTKNRRKKSFQNVVEIIKSFYNKYTSVELKELMLNLPNQMWTDMIQYFIIFLDQQKILAIQKVIVLAQLNLDTQKKMMEAIDVCIENNLEENGLALYYAIKYFTVRKITDKGIVKKICPMVIHPYLWIRDQAKSFIEMCLVQNPPTRMFILLRQVFEPPFPLQQKDIIDDILLPKCLTESEVDFSKKCIKENRKIGLTEKLFIQYLEKTKTMKEFPVQNQDKIEEWNKDLKPFRQRKNQPINFSTYIKKSIYELFQANFLCYVGTISTVYNPQTNEEKERAYAELHDVFRKTCKFSVEDNIISYEKRMFFSSMFSLINSNFEKLLTKSIKEDTNNKFKIAEGIYLIMEALYRFEQLNIQKTMKLGQYSRKGVEPEKLQKPKGTLMTQIFQHKDAITSLEKIADTFLISGSYDGTYRVFNMKNLQMNVTAGSEAVFEIGSDQLEEKAKINSIAAFESTYTIAVGTNRGQIRISHIERMPSKAFELPNRQSYNSMDAIKYSVGGEVQKIITLKNQQQNQCFCFVTAEGNLGIQDIRVKSKTMVCNIGRERGLPKCLAYSPNATSVLIGTIDGYLLCYDVRCNIISNILQLNHDQQNVSITGIYPVPTNILKNTSEYIYAFTYPSKHYELSYFNIYEDGKEFRPLKHYTSADPESIISLPTFTNRTKDENFKLCSNNLTQKMYYKQLPDFNRNFQIMEHLSDPLTLRESKIRQFWMDRCKHRYNQIYSVYNKKSLPFVQHVGSGVLTHLNPCIQNPSEYKSNKNLTVLVDKKEQKESYTEIQRFAFAKQGNLGIHTFLEEEAPNHLTACQLFPNVLAVGGWDSVIKIYK